MKNKLTLLAATVAATIAFTASVQAVPITGTVTFGGGVTLDSGSTVVGATKVLTWASPTPYVSGSSGDLSAAIFTGASFATPWTFAGATAGLWSYLASNGDTFTFNLNAGSVVSVLGSGSTAQLSVIGDGMISATGPNSFQNTVGTWSFTTQNPSGAGSVFSFSAASGTVPDGGMTVLLLGAALTGLFLVRKQVLA